MPFRIQLMQTALANNDIYGAIWFSVCYVRRGRVRFFYYAPRFFDSSPANRITNAHPLAPQTVRHSFARCRKNVSNLVACAYSVCVLYVCMRRIKFMYKIKLFSDVWAPNRALHEAKKIWIRKKHEKERKKRNSDKTKSKRKQEGILNEKCISMMVLNVLRTTIWEVRWKWRNE